MPGGGHPPQQIQALARTQPLLPLRPGQVERRTHDHKPCGTTSLFAALDVQAGTIIGKCMLLHRVAEFGSFLDTVEANIPEGLDIYVVMDNASSHKAVMIRNWFAKRPRWHVHYTPTSASWFNQVERVFALLTDDAIRRSAYRSTAELEAAITAYTEAHSAEPKPFCRTKTADDILTAVQRFCHAPSTSRPTAWELQSQNTLVVLTVPAIALAHIDGQPVLASTFWILKNLARHCVIFYRRLSFTPM